MSQRKRENQVYLPGVQIPENVQIRNSMCEVVQGCDVVLIAVPSHFFRSVAQQLMPLVAERHDVCERRRRVSKTTR